VYAQPEAKDDTTTAHGGQVAGATALAFALLLLAAPARAHNVAADLSVWGNFGADTAACQRVIARAAALCAGRVLVARSACASDQLQGGACDQTQLDDRIQAARERARSMVEAGCSAQELQTLRYVDLSDALTDVINVCRELDTSASTASYGPAMFGGTIAAVDGSKQTCLDVTGRAANRLLRFAMRTRSRALDDIASAPIAMTLGAKTALLQRSARAIARAADLSKRRILTACPNADFTAAYGHSVDDLLGRIAGRADCLAQSVYVQNAVTCPPAVCGDGMQSSPEECDDGNQYDGDGCRADCTKTNCTVFPTTFDLIQRAIFENHGCTNDSCHGAAQSGGMDLRAGSSYAHLIDVDAQTVPGFKRIAAGDKDGSLLWINLAGATLPDQYKAPLRAMPLGLAPISADELEALRLWIETGGAARDANLPAAASLLNACVPEPEPVKIEPLAPPAAGSGVQLHMPAYTLRAHSESEVCFSTYYDISDQIPAAFLTDDGLRFRYESIDIRQDPLSHHLIVDVFRGNEAANDPVWGTYKCRGGEHDGAVCDPLDLTACGSGACATDPDPTAIACIGFGPTPGLGTLTSGGFAFAQETTAHFRYPHQVYNELPVRGVLLWNSHAFNLTSKDGTLEAWVNINFPDAEQQKYKAEQIFNVSKIFWTDRFPPIPSPVLPTFQDMEVCQIHIVGPEGGFGNSVIQSDETAHIFELSGHMHQHGVRFQIFRGRFTCKGGANDGQACSPFQVEMCPAGQCTDDGGRDPQQALLYTNYIYNDPIILRLDPPILMSGSAPLVDRTFTYCGHYDNGKAPNIEKVKRRSTSPPAGVLFDFFSVGGPCAESATRCIGGPNHNQLCNGDDAVCESSPGAGDGDCDACPLTGGFRTQDEMFVLFGNYWVTKN